MSDLLLIAAAVLAPVVPVAVAVRELARRRLIREMRDLAVFERNRNRFGELRTRLMDAVRAGTISPESKHFRSLYGVLTTLMRNPHDYTRAAQSLLRLELSTDGAADHSAVEGELYVALAQRLDLLCRDYSRIYRFAAWVSDRLQAAKARPGEGFVSMPLWIGMAMQRTKSAQRVAPVTEASRKLEIIGEQLRAA